MILHEKLRVILCQIWYMYVSSYIQHHMKYEMYHFKDIIYLILYIHQKIDCIDTCIYAYC